MSVALTAEMAVQLYHNTAYIVYLCCVAVVAPLAFLLYTYGTHLEKRGSKRTLFEVSYGGGWLGMLLTMK